MPARRSVLRKTVPLVYVWTLASGLGAYTRPRAQFFSIQTSQPANNIYIFQVTTCEQVIYHLFNKKNTKIDLQLHYFVIIEEYCNRCITIKTKNLY